MWSNPALTGPEPRSRDALVFFRVRSCPSQLQGPVRVSDPSAAPGKGSEPAGPCRRASAAPSQAEDIKAKDHLGPPGVPSESVKYTGPDRVAALVCE